MFFLDPRYINGSIISTTGEYENVVGWSKTYYYVGRACLGLLAFIDWGTEMFGNGTRTGLAACAGLHSLSGGPSWLRVRHSLCLRLPPPLFRPFFPV